MHTTSIVYPSSFGYQFDPEPKNNSRFILKELNEATSNSESQVRPFLKISWFGDRFIKKGRIYLIGYSTHNIKNEIHRGSISVWCAATIEPVAVRKSSNYWIIKETFDYFSNSMKNEWQNPKFYSSFNKYVKSEVSSELIDDAHKELLSCIDENHGFLNYRLFK